MLALPIDPLLPELCAALVKERSVVLVAPPGAGKTTRVPRALLDAGLGERGEIVVLEPRRLAVRMAARRVAEELGEPVGETVGYQMRFEEAVGPRTRVRFVTEGILTRRLLADPELRGVRAVLLDEFHERHLHGDVALALLRRLQRGPRPDLLVAAMSATLDAGPVAAFLEARVFHAEGRRFEVAIEHLLEGDDRKLELTVASALRRVVDEGLDGSVLVFLPGALEIRRAMEACAALCAREGLAMLPLHGSLSAAEQDRATGASALRKVIFSTNVAETSVTIDGVVAVIDSGLARVATHAPWSGISSLRVAKVSRASATQRAGRAGRTRPGRCLRLYTRGDLAARPEHDAPEVARADLAETALELFAAGVPDLAAFPWFEAPPPASLAAAGELLLRLGALTAEAPRGLTATGRRMLRFPVHPRLARMLVEAERRGVADDGATAAALLSERDLWGGGGGGGGGGGRGQRRDARHRSDVAALLDLYFEAETVDFAPDRLRRMDLDPARVGAVQRVKKQLGRLVDRRAVPSPGSLEARDRELAISLLAGFPDRVGRLRRPANATGRAAREVVFAGGGTAGLAEACGVAEVDLLVAIDAEERAEGRSMRTQVRVASAIESDWLLELFTERIRDTTEVTWNAAAERVEVTRRLAYEALVLEETPLAQGSPVEVGRVLAQAALAKGLRAFVDGDELERWNGRVEFLRRHAPELELPAASDAGLASALAAACEGLRSFAELRRADLAGRLRGQLRPDQARRLAELAPESVGLRGGRRLRVVYEPGQAPHVASRLQDFFGMVEGPKVAGGRVPVVLHLLAPNQRAVQVTTDLAGFWSRHYPAIARELRRKYPRHRWPDDPLAG